MKKKTKLQIAQEEYLSRPSYSFMKSQNDNYWTENRKIIQDYAQYYASSASSNMYNSYNRKFTAAGVDTATASLQEASVASSSLRDTYQMKLPMTIPAKKGSGYMKNGKW